MNKLDKDYLALVQDILDNGVKKQDRTGTGTISVFGRQIRHKMSDGFPLLTTKKLHWKSIVTELLWFLRGDTNIKYLVENGVHIWDGDAYKNYLSKINNGRIYPNSFTQEEFINKCKTDSEFSKKWGLKIEERELSQHERVKLLQKAWKNNGILPEYEEVSTLWVEYNNLMTKYNIPTKLITITYNNETIEIYE